MPFIIHALAMVCLRSFKRQIGVYQNFKKDSVLHLITQSELSAADSVELQGILAQHGLILHGIRPTRFFFSFQFLAQHVYICPTRFFQILFFKTVLNRNPCQRRTPCSNPSHEKTWFLSDCNIQLGIPNQDQEVIVVMTIDKAPQILA